MEYGRRPDAVEDRVSAGRPCTKRARGSCDQLLDRLPKGRNNNRWSRLNRLRCQILIESWLSAYLSVVNRSKEPVDRDACSGLPNMILDSFLIQIQIRWFLFLQGFSGYIKRGIIPNYCICNWLIIRSLSLSVPRT